MSPAFIHNLNGIKKEFWKFIFAQLIGMVFALSFSRYVYPIRYSYLFKLAILGSLSVLFASLFYIYLFRLIIPFYSGLPKTHQILLAGIFLCVFAAASVILSQVAGELNDDPHSIYEFLRISAVYLLLGLGITACILLTYQYPTICVLVFAFVVAGAIIYEKRYMVSTWNYVSGIFTMDTALQESIKGRIGLEFRFGNTFGDHAYFLFFLLMPFKLLLGTRMYELLNLIGPIFYLLSTASLFLLARRLTGPRNAVLITLPFLTGITFIFRGGLELPNGFHPDSQSGFLAVIFTVLLIWAQSQVDLKSPKKLLAGFFICYGIFLSLQEEMALLGVVFFLGIFVFQRRRFNLAMAGLSAVAFGLEMAFIRFHQTPYNRTNALLFSTTIQRIQTKGLFGFLFGSLRMTSNLTIYWILIIILTGCMAFAILYKRKINPAAFGLFLMGLVKLFSSFLVYEFTITRWHNFPAVIMLVGAILIQTIYNFEPNSDRKSIAWYILPYSMVLISLYGFLTVDVRYYRAHLDQAINDSRIVAVLRQELGSIKKEIDPERIVAIPPITAVEWVGYRYTFYPLGVSMMPIGIADYIVLPLDSPKFSTEADKELYAIPNVDPCFVLTESTPHFNLYTRKCISVEQQKMRQDFMQRAKLNLD